MDMKVSHDRKDETIESKTLWFCSLSLSQRMDLLCEFTDLALAVNPGLAEKRHAEPAQGRVQILSRT
jgi:hypothetical protein